jgi:hypothetical protein
MSVQQQRQLDKNIVKRITSIATVLMSISLQKQRLTTMIS